MPNPETLLEHAGFLRSLARGLLRDEAQADDVVQQTLLAALKQPPEDRSNLRGWLAGVAKNLARMRRRSEGRRNRRERAAARPEGLASTAEVAARLDMQQRVVAAVRELDEPYRSVIVFRFFDELRPAEIAERMGVPVDTVKTRLKRALNQLRHRFDREVEGGRRAWSLALLPLALPQATAKAGVAAAAFSLGGLLTMKTVFTLSAVLIVAVAFLFNANAGDRGASAPRSDTARETIAATPAPAVAGAEAGAPETDAAASQPTHELKGVVRAEGGDPIAHATVVPLAFVFGEGMVEKTPTWRADAQGRIRVRHGARKVHVRVRHPRFLQADATLREGKEPVIELKRGAPLSVLVRGPDGAPVEGARVVANSVVMFSNWDQWSVEPVETRTMYGAATTDATGRADVGAIPVAPVELFVDHPAFARAVVYARPASLAPLVEEIELKRGGTVTGRVLAPDGSAVAGARVHAKRYEERSVTTDEQGRFRLAAVAPGERYLFAAADGHGPGAFGRALGWGEEVAVKVRDGETVRDLDIVLTKPTFVTGRVVDADGAGVAGVHVLARARLWPGGRVTGTTGADGAFRIGPLALRDATPVKVAFAKDIFTFADLQPVRVEEGADLDVGTVTASAPGTITGTVRGPDALPDDLVVRAIVPGERYVSVTARVNPDGTFRIRINSGSVLLLAEHEGLSSGRIPVKVEPGATVADVALVLRPARFIAGRVLTDRRDPVSLQKLMAVGATETQEGWVDVDGNFRFTDLKDDEYRVGLVHYWDGKNAMLDAPAPQVLRVGTSGVEFLVAEKGPVVEGAVVAERDGQPVRQFHVSLIRYRLFVPTDHSSRSVRSQDGRFRVAVTEPGMYAVEVDAPGLAPVRTAKFTIGKDTGQDVGTLRLGPPGRVRGVARDITGQPVRFARVHLLSAQLQVSGRAPFTDADGRFTVGGLAPGQYTAFVVSPRHPLGIQRGVAVVGGQTTTLDAHLPAASPLTLLVRDPEGRPVAGAKLVYTFPALKPFHSGMVEAYEPPGFGSNISDKDGTIRKPNMPAGSVEIQVEADGFAAHRQSVELAAGEAQEVAVTLIRE